MAASISTYQRSMIVRSASGASGSCTGERGSWNPQKAWWSPSGMPVNETISS